MSMRLPMIASLFLLGASGIGHAQSLPVDFDAGSYAAPSADAAGMAAAEQHPPSTTETSVAHARAVRRGGHTITLIDSSAPPPPANLVSRLASAGS